MVVLDEFRKTNTLQASYFGGTIIRVGSQNQSPLPLTIIFPKGMDAPYHFVMESDKGHSITLFLEELLQRTLVLNIYLDNSIQTDLSQRLSNHGLSAEAKFNQDLEKYRSLRTLKEIFKVEYKYTRKAIPQAPLTMVNSEDSDEIEADNE
jgi:hypothetical protein